MYKRQDLCRAIDLPCTLDFMAVSSYGKGTKSSGQVQITKDLSEDITDRHIIVVEDILDSGNTLSYLLKTLENRHPASIRLCTLLDKPDRRVKPVQVHYAGFTIPDAFVVGYGCLLYTAGFTLGQPEVEGRLHLPPVKGTGHLHRPGSCPDRAGQGQGDVYKRQAL